MIRTIFSLEGRWWKNLRFGARSSGSTPTVGSSRGRGAGAPRGGHPPAHPPGGGGDGVAPAIGDVDEPQERVGTAGNRVVAETMEPPEEGDVLRDGQVAVD